MAKLSVSTYSTTRTLFSSPWDSDNEDGTDVWCRLQGMHRPRFKCSSRSPYDHLVPAKSLSTTSGSVMKVRQSAGIIAIASAVADGTADMDDQEPSAYNREGNLRVWCDGTEFTLYGHERSYTSEGRDMRRFYTVNDVQFDPALPTRLVSCGHDLTVKVWDCTAVESGATALEYATTPEYVQTGGLCARRGGLEWTRVPAAQYKFEVPDRADRRFGCGRRRGGPHLGCGELGQQVIRNGRRGRRRCAQGIRRHQGQGDLPV
ncbi:hypothetical protein BKA93DRAFT_238206 [Sparassis latifolia]